jgi:hypothetical protein
MALLYHLLPDQMMQQPQAPLISKQRCSSDYTQTLPQLWQLPHQVEMGQPVLQLCQYLHPPSSPVTRQFPSTYYVQLTGYWRTVWAVVQGRAFSKVRYVVIFGIHGVKADGISIQIVLPWQLQYQWYQVWLKVTVPLPKPTIPHIRKVNSNTLNHFYVTKKEDSSPNIIMY